MASGPTGTLARRRFKSSCPTVLTADLCVSKVTSLGRSIVDAQLREEVWGGRDPRGESPVAPTAHCGVQIWLFCLSSTDWIKWALKGLRGLDQALVLHLTALQAARLSKQWD